MTGFLIAYYVLSFAQSVPCIYKLIRTKSSKDYSLLNRLCQYTALLCFTIYIFTNPTSKPSVEIIGVVDVVLLTIENILILLYRKGGSNESNNIK